MTLPLKPKHGGFLRPFGCGWFIREFLLGHGPYGSSVIDSQTGAPQADIFYSYKQALRHITALDRATSLEEKKARKENRPINPDNIESLIKRYLEGLPYKSLGCRYHSFVTYFSSIQKLGWVEPSGKEETLAFQDHYPPAKSRKYFRLTQVGMAAPDTAWARPYRTLYS